MYIYSHNDNKKRDGIKLFFVVILTIFFTVVLLENIIILMQKDSAGYSAQRLGQTTYENTTRYATNQINTTNIIESIKESTVGISLLKPNGENILDIDLAEKWGMGTGVIVSKKGYILTNEHLAQTVGARLVVTLNDGKMVQGKVIWNEENIDLAIIKIDEKKLIAAELRRFKLYKHG